MQSFPHRYTTRASGHAEGTVGLDSAGLPAMAVAAPAEFGGPGDRWSPETLLAGAVATCFILTFRAVARASRLDWTELVCEVEGILDRVEGETRFTEMLVRAFLEVPPGVAIERAERILEKSERGCLITRSLRAESRLEAHVHTAVPAS
jgi:organic hydroperoxide reductase OsmC/OhrA